MTETIGIIEVLTAIIGAPHTWAGLAALLVVAFAYRWGWKGESPAKIFGFRNGYVQEKSFLGAMSRIEKLIEDKADLEGKRMDKHGEEIDGLREQVQLITERTAETKTKVEMLIEQYRLK